jgi:hypothetical protein
VFLSQFPGEQRVARLSLGENPLVCLLFNYLGTLRERQGIPAWLSRDRDGRTNEEEKDEDED